MDILLFTQRLFLRLVSPHDLEDIHDLHTLPETDEFNILGIPVDIDQTAQILQDWIEASEREQSPEYTFSIRDRKTGAFIGLIHLKCGNPLFHIAEVWYKLHVKHWRKGYATEALNRVLDFGFKDLKLHRIEAGAAVANIASIRLLEKVGMSREGRKKKALPLKSGWSDSVAFAILEEDWREINNESHQKNLKAKL